MIVVFVGRAPSTAIISNPRGIRRFDTLFCVYVTQGWTTKTDTWYYTAMMVTTSLVPILINPFLTKWTDSRSPKEVFVVIPLLCAAGLGPPSHSSPKDQWYGLGLGQG